MPSFLDRLTQVFGVPSSFGLYLGNSAIPASPKSVLSSPFPGTVVNVLHNAPPGTNQVCNTLIARAMALVGDGEVFRLIDEGQERGAAQLLESVLKVRGGRSNTSFARSHPMSLFGTARVAAGTPTISAREIISMIRDPCLTKTFFMWKWELLHVGGCCPNSCLSPFQVLFIPCIDPSTHLVSSVRRFPPWLLPAGQNCLGLRSVAQFATPTAKDDAVNCACRRACFPPLQG